MFGVTQTWSAVGLDRAAITRRRRAVDELGTPENHPRCACWRRSYFRHGLLEWLESQWNSDYPALYKLRSVGQHYGMDTGLLDATTSVPVALWFATHDFATGAYR